MKSYRIGLVSCVIFLILSSLTNAAVVEITDNITSNAIWRADNVYHVTAPIHVPALLVIEPGTQITFGAGAYLYVENGGCLMARGTPDKIIQFLPDDQNQQTIGTFSAIIIDKTASPACKISYCLIEQAYMGIYTNDIQLDDPIQNNTLNFCMYGIYEQGIRLTDIFNNQFYESYGNPDPYSPQYFWGGAIVIDVWSSEEQESPESEIQISNNTCNYSDYYAITILGAVDPANNGKIKIFNNILANSGYGILWVGQAFLYIANNGYFNNATNRNFSGDEPYAVEMPSTAQSPFEVGTGSFDLAYLKQTCPFINAGCGGIEIKDVTNPGEYYITIGPTAMVPEILGFTTALNKIPDNDTLDIGFHYPNFDTANAGNLSADLNNDGVINQDDRTILMNHYGQSGLSHDDGDINGDNITDLYDLRLMRKQWGQTGQRFPDLAPAIPGGNLSGKVNVGLAGNPNELVAAYLWMDGENIGGYPLTATNNYIPVTTNYYANGEHHLKLVGVLPDGRIGLSKNIKINLNNTLSCVSASSVYQTGETYYFNGLYSGSSGAVLKLNGLIDGEVWNTTLGNQPIAMNPTSFSNKAYTVGVNESGTSLFSMPLSEEFSKWKTSNSFKVLITFSPRDEEMDNLAQYRLNAVFQATRAKFAANEWLYIRKPNWEELSCALKKPNLMYWYNLAHGSHAEFIPLYGMVDRTNFDISRKGSKGKDYDCYTAVFSFMQRDQGLVPLWPATYQPFDSFTESYGYTIASLGIGNNSQLKIVFMDFCESGYAQFYDPYGQRFNDMALATGAYQADDPPERLYFGWFNAANANNGSSDDDKYVARLWSCGSGHGLGGPNSAKTAVLYADQYKFHADLPGRLEFYGFAYQWYQYPGLEIIYFAP